MALSLSEYCYQVLIRNDGRALLQACQQVANHYSALTAANPSSSADGSGVVSEPQQSSSQPSKRLRYMLRSCIPTSVAIELFRRLQLGLTSQHLLMTEYICPEIFDTSTDEVEHVDEEFWAPVFKRYVLV
jgi:hypothetical protein